MPTTVLQMPAQFGGSVMQGARSPISFVLVHGIIEGYQHQADALKSTKYDVIIPQLFGAEQDEDVKAILVALHTVGGDVEAGLAIAETLASLSKPTASIILGGGHSIGLPIAVAATRSFIVPSASVAVHPIRGGLIVNAPEMFQQLAATQDRISDFVCAHSGVTKVRLKHLMSRHKLPGDVGSLLSGEEAVHEKLVDELGGLAEAVTFLRQACGA